MKAFLLLRVALLGVFLPALPGYGAEKPERSPDFYKRHILAVDLHGSALMPEVRRTGSSYSVKLHAMEGEETADLQTALGGRWELHQYITEMFTQMAMERPRKVVIYIHGGLNRIGEAVEKTARMADYFAETDIAEDQGIYYIGICWNSALTTTYGEHLFKVREGLRQPARAIISAPAAFLADVGGAISRAPLRMIDLFYNDVFSVNPEGFSRHRAAQHHLQQMENSPDNAAVFYGGDDRPRTAKWFNSTMWGVTLPVKAASVPIIDMAGSEPWKNMLRRTRTMFERESTFIPAVPWATIEEEVRRRTGRQPTRAQVARLAAQLDTTGRVGAVRQFCAYASDYIYTLQARRGSFVRPSTTLIGHSMGAIVAAEMLHRSHTLSAERPLPFDDVVLMAAACSINDFKNKIVPYLQAPANRRTRFYNLCLNNKAERIEANPELFGLNLDLAPRGSLLVWIDTLYQKPESENDRTFGRWENAILAADDIPSGVLKRMTVKAFGRDRLLAKSPAGLSYTILPAGGKRLLEPMRHGDFSRYDAKDPRKSFAFWRPNYWKPEVRIDTEDTAGALPRSARSDAPR